MAEQDDMVNYGINLYVFKQNCTRAAQLLGRRKHGYRNLMPLVIQACKQEIPLTTLTMMEPVNLKADIGLSSVGFMVIAWFAVMLSQAGRIMFFDKLCETLGATAAAEDTIPGVTQENITMVEAKLSELMTEILGLEKRTEHYVPLIQSVAEAISIQYLAGDPQTSFEVHVQSGHSSHGS
jgi:hypothetical protein